MDNFLFNSPYSKGRWYHGFLESTGEAFQVTTSDTDEELPFFIHNSSTNLYLGSMTDDGWRVTDLKHDFHYTESISPAALAVKRGANGGLYTSVPAIDKWDYADVWVFAYKE